MFKRLKSLTQTIQLDKILIKFIQLELDSIKKVKIYCGINTEEKYNNVNNWWTPNEDYALTYIKNKGWLATTTIGNKVIDSGLYGTPYDLYFPDSIARRFKTEYIKIN